MANDRITSDDSPASPSGKSVLERDRPLSERDELETLRMILKNPERAQQMLHELPPLVIDLNKGRIDKGAEINRDCGTKTCTVKGSKYTSNFAIPGNEPVLLTHQSGSAVEGPDGMPVNGPRRANLDFIGHEFSLYGPNGGLLPLAAKFKHNGQYDFQRMQTDNGALFTMPYRHFTNIAIGFAGAAAGIGPDVVASMANYYCTNKCQFSKSEQKSDRYPALPLLNVKDLEIGMQLWKERQYSISVLKNPQ